MRNCGKKKGCLAILSRILGRVQYDCASIIDSIGDFLVPTILHMVDAYSPIHSFMNDMVVVCVLE